MRLLSWLISAFGDDFPLKEVTQLLSIDPTESYNKGDIIVRPKNDNVTNMTVNYRKETAWILSSGYQESFDISDQLYLLLDFLEDKVNELKRIQDEYKVSYKFIIVINIENNEKPENKMELFINTLLEKRDAESKLVDCERVLWLNQSEDCAVTISIIRKTGVPEFKRISSIEQEPINPKPKDSVEKLSAGEQVKCNCS
ncbi:DUF4279 domain-containing protein [Paenibacillus naphthalenovorans]|uniref:DUF4279 domain-containing protein n=1 Tax=Paenibacillus naphthalenovorans TaxID=162209 RepID=UPI003D2818E1